MIIALETQSTNHASGKDRIEGTGGTSLVNSNHKGVQEGVPDVIPAEACYLGWQESLILLGKLVEAEIPD